MKRGLILTLVLLAGLWGAVPRLTESGGGLAFPDIPGFSKPENPRYYDPETLFEYINGKAGSYLDFGFQELATLVYVGETEQRITVDVYRHRDWNNGFGIYSSERPREGHALNIGGGGYRQEGTVNFFKGPYYVKLAGENLEPGGDTLLVAAARTLSLSMEGEAGLPPTASCLPKEQRAENSLRFVARGFLGHGFLHSAFVAEYETDAGEFRAFVIEAADEPEAEQMLGSYLDLVRRKKETLVEENGVHRFRDPYRISEGTLNVKRSGVYFFGVFQDEPALADGYLETMQENIARLAK